MKISGKPHDIYMGMAVSIACVSSNIFLLLSWLYSADSFLPPIGEPRINCVPKMWPLHEDKRTSLTTDLH